MSQYIYIHTHRQIIPQYIYYTKLITASEYAIWHLHEECIYGCHWLYAFIQQHVVGLYISSACTWCVADGGGWHSNRSNALHVYYAPRFDESTLSQKPRAFCVWLLWLFYRIDSNAPRIYMHTLKHMCATRNYIYCIHVDGRYYIHDDPTRYGVCTICFASAVQHTFRTSQLHLV